MSDTKIAGRVLRDDKRTKQIHDYVAEAALQNKRGARRNRKSRVKIVTLDKPLDTKLANEKITFYRVRSRITGKKGKDKGVVIDTPWGYYSTHLPVTRRVIESITEETDYVIVDDHGMSILPDVDERSSSANQTHGESDDDD